MVSKGHGVMSDENASASGSPSGESLENGMSYKSMFLNSQGGVISEAEILAFFNGKQRITSDRTRKSYHGPLTRFRKFLLAHNLEVNDVQPWHVAEFADQVKQTINYRTRKPGVSDSTVLLNLSAVSSCYTWRVETGRSDWNPFKEFRFRRTERPRAVSPFTPETVTKMCQLAGSNEKIAIVKLFRRSGIRNQELVAMNKDSIEIEQLVDGADCGIVNVVGKGGKTRRVYVSPDALDAIADYLETRGADSEPALFVSRRKRRVSIRTTQRWIRKMAAAAGDDHGHPHRLRHLYCSEMAAGGMPEGDLRARLGHEDVSTTHIYKNVSDERLIADCRNALQKMGVKRAA